MASSSSRSYKREEIRKVMSEGVIVHGRHLTLRGLVLGGPTKTWGAIISVPRAAGGAVVRNRLRRRLRGIVGEASDELPNGVRLIVSYKTKEPRSFQELDVELRQLLVNLGRELREQVGR